VDNAIRVTVHGKAGVGKTQAVSVMREAFLAMGISVEVINPEGDCPDARTSGVDLRNRNVTILIEEKQAHANS
jgi:nucleoside-triphosphatase THEP1